MKLFALLPVASASMLYSMKDIDGMRETFKSVAASKKIDATTRGFIQNYMDDINGTLIASLYTVKADTQTALNAARAAVEQCSTDRDGTFAGDVTTKAGNRDTSRGAHLASKGNTKDGCTRQVVQGGGFAPSLLQQTPGHDYTYDFSRHWGHEDEGAEMKSFTEDNAHHIAEVAKTASECAAFDDMESKCTTLDDHVKRLTVRQGTDFCDEANQLRHGTHGADPHGPAAHRDIEAWEAASDETDNVFIWFSFMDSFERANVAQYKTERVNCHDARNAHQHKVISTHRAQHEFERDYCAWSDAIDTACSTYGSCYTRDYALWSTQNTTAQDIQNQIRAQNHALECLLCYGNQILREDANPDLSACDNQPCADCDNFNLDYSDPHAERTCDERQTDKPCTTTFVDNEYGCFKDTTPADTCLECASSSE